MMGSHEDDEYESTTYDEEYESTNYDDDVEMDMSGFLNNPPTHLMDKAVEEPYRPPVTPRPRQQPNTGVGYTAPNSFFSDPTSINAHQIGEGGWHSFRPSWAHDASMRGNPIVVSGAKTIGSALFVASALYNLGYREGTEPSRYWLQQDFSGDKSWSRGASKAMVIGFIPLYLQPSLGWNYGALDAIMPSGGFAMKVASTGAKVLTHGGLAYLTVKILRN